MNFTSKRFFSLTTHLVSSLVFAVFVLFLCSLYKPASLFSGELVTPAPASTMRTVNFAPAGVAPGSGAPGSPDYSQGVPFEFRLRSIQASTGREPFLTRSKDVAVVRFDLDIDFTGVFQWWNTHMVFVYLVAEFETDAQEINHVTIWDDRVSRDAPHLTLTNARSEYLLSGVSNSLRDLANGRLALHWNVVPVLGSFSYQRSPAGHLEPGQPVSHPGLVPFKYST
ncbi:hypothetical protein H696_04476 [Fonticula alba]|uniref:Signal peptidase complex subunit 3 n=1 Tax=Fonticula alba TaxID=691883 RepID=A0A058Z6B8_FONAL|nr:hypothetical protein H696_04476 [Fonticula alba]KCV69057.1 hypothetical protein H696_04476 [Fonticula alba]|eukprot:XP_009496628.1 hypothetical protein H696_04476 [Fonticula alba]